MQAADMFASFHQTTYTAIFIIKVRYALLLTQLGYSMHMPTCLLLDILYRKYISNHFCIVFHKYWMICIVKVTIFYQLQSGT